MPIRLRQHLPRAGFNWRSRSALMPRARDDFDIQIAMRSHGAQAMKDITNDENAGFQFNRQNVTELLIHMLKAVTEAIRDDYTGSSMNGDFNMALMNAVSLAQAQIDWYAQLSPGVAFKLVLELVNARMRYIQAHPEANADPRESIEATAAVRLQWAVTNLVNAFTAGNTQRRWTGVELIDRIDAITMAAEAALAGSAGNGGGTGAEFRIPENTNNNTGPIDRLLGTLMGGIGMDEMADMEEQEMEDEDEMDMD